MEGQGSWRELVMEAVTEADAGGRPGEVSGAGNSGRPAELAGADNGGK